MHLEHIGIVVDDLAAATEFFTALGLEVEGEASVEGDLVDRINGLEGVQTDIVILRAPDGDGSKLELTTNGSNLIGLGGPWQTTIGGVTYMQLSPDFVFAIANLVKVLDLAIGEPMGAMCRGYDIQREVLGAAAP